MSSMPRIVGAFALACLSSVATAKMVEVEFAVNVTSKVTTTIHNGVGTTVTDAAFQPVSFAASFRFDMDQPSAQERMTSPSGAAQAWTAYDLTPSSTSFTATPFTSALQLPSPAGVASNDDVTATHGRYQSIKPTDLDHVTPVKEQITFSAQTNWLAHGIDGAGTTTLHMASRNIQLVADGSPLSFNQFTELSGEDTLAFLQTQVGVLRRDAFHESGGHAVMPSDWRHAIAGRNIEYKGDVLIRSVSVVPEPGALLLGLVGTATVAACAGRRKR